MTALAEAAAAGEGPSTTQLMHQMMETVATATAKAEADAIAERGGAQQSGEDSQQAAAAHAQAQSAALVSSLLQATGAGMPPGEALAAMMRTPHFRDILRTLDADARAELIALLKAEHQAALQVLVASQASLGVVYTRYAHSLWFRHVAGRGTACQSTAGRRRRGVRRRPRVAAAVQAPSAGEGGRRWRWRCCRCRDLHS